jgi:hypothetical protein
MDLRQRAEQEVKDMLAAYGQDLGTIRAVLDLGTQETGGYWEFPNTDFASIDPCVRAGHIRQLAAGRVCVQGWSAPVLHTLRPKRGSFAALHLYTPQGQRVRVRKRPPDRRTGLPMRASSEPDLFSDTSDSGGAPEDADTLFGYGASAQPYEISILMDIDLGTKTLKAAWLAAIYWGKDDKGQKIYYEEEIPAASLGMLGGPGGGSPSGTPGEWNPPSGSGFEDLLREEGEGTGSDPA